MDGRGRCFDNIFTERLWRSMKYEEIYTKDYQSFEEAEEELGRYFETYNNRRLHSSLGYRPPSEVYFQEKSRLAPEKLTSDIYLKNTILVSE